ncbi:hypothetical protein [Microbacterium sp. SLBN-111]
MKKPYGYAATVLAFVTAVVALSVGSTWAGAFAVLTGALAAYATIGGERR